SGGAKIDEVPVGIVGEAIPYGAAALVVGRAMRIPGLVGDGERGILIGLSWRAGHGEEPPFELARLLVVGGDVAAHAALVHVGAAVADDGEVAGHVDRAGAGVGFRVVDEGV